MNNKIVQFFQGCSKLNLNSLIFTSISSSIDGFKIEFGVLDFCGFSIDPAQTFFFPLRTSFLRLKSDERHILRTIRQIDWEVPHNRISR